MQVSFHPAHYYTIRSLCILTYYIYVEFSKLIFIYLLFHENNKFKTLIVCSDGVITEKLCPDGMVFNDYSIDQEKCDLPFNIDCTKRSKLREYLCMYTGHSCIPMHVCTYTRYL